MDRKERKKYDKQISKAREFADKEQAIYERLKEKNPKYFTTYNAKLVIAGFNIVYTTYDEPIFKGFKRRDSSVNTGSEQRKEAMELRKKMDAELIEYTRRFPDATKDDKEALAALAEIKEKYGEVLQIREDNEKRKINKFKNLVQANYDEWTHFVTLHIKENLMDVTKAKNELKEWLKKMRLLFPDFLYIYVMEFQQRGSIHFHMLVRADKGKRIDRDTKFKQWVDSWQHGGIDIKGVSQKYIPKKEREKAEKEIQALPADKRLRIIWSIGSYLTSYLKKGADDVLLFGKKMYGSSRDLKEEIVITDERVIKQWLKWLEVEKLKSNEYTFEQKGLENKKKEHAHAPQVTKIYYNKLIPKQTQPDAKNIKK